MPPPTSGPEALPVPAPTPERPAGPSQPSTPTLDVPAPVPAPAPVPPLAPAPAAAAVDASVATPGTAPTEVPAPSPGTDRAGVPTVAQPPNWPLEIGTRFGEVLDGVRQTLDRVVPHELGPIREPLIQLVPILLAILGAFLALQRGIGRGLGHVPMVASPARRHTVTRD